MWQRAQHAHAMSDASVDAAGTLGNGESVSTLTQSRATAGTLAQSIALTPLADSLNQGVRQHRELCDALLRLQVSTRLPSLAVWLPVTAKDMVVAVYKAAAACTSSDRSGVWPLFTRDRGTMAPPPLAALLSGRAVLAADGVLHLPITDVTGHVRLVCEAPAPAELLSQQLVESAGLIALAADFEHPPTVLRGLVEAQAQQVARAWQSDASAPACACCRTEFALFNRRHHCRTCLLVVCGECSTSRRAEVGAPPADAHPFHRAVRRRQPSPTAGSATSGLRRWAGFAWRLTASALACAGTRAARRVGRRAPLHRVLACRLPSRRLWRTATRSRLP